jgi:hypothetical protein
MVKYSQDALDDATAYGRHKANFNDKGLKVVDTVFLLSFTFFLMFSRLHEGGY